MSFLRFSLLGMLGLVSFVGLGCAAIVGTVRAQVGSPAPYWWSSAVVTLTALFMGLCLLGAVFSRGQARCGWAGAALAGTVYWVLIFSTWFGSSVGTRLVTSRAIVWAEQKMYASVQQQAGAAQTLPLDAYYSGLGMPGGYPAYVNMGPPGMVSTTMMPGGGSGMWPGAYYTPVATVAPVAPTSGTDLSGPPSTAFQEIAHYLVIWPLAVIGGLLASLIYARSRRALAPDVARDGPGPAVGSEFRAASAVTAAVPVFAEYAAPRARDEDRAHATSEGEMNGPPAETRREVVPSEGKV